MRTRGEGVQNPENFADVMVPSDELNDMLKSAKRRRMEPTTPKRPLTNRGLLENLKREMKFYETNGTRSRSLELLRKALNSVPVTSVEAERVRQSIM